MILTVLSGRQETEWFDIEVADEYSVEHLKLMLGVRIFRRTSGGRHAIYYGSKVPGRALVQGGG